MNLNWNSEKSELLLPLHWENKLTLSDLPNLSGHVWLSTSGSSMAPKLVALSKQALLNSAKSVNQWLQVTAQDVWVNVLPCYHVGGLSVV